MKLIPSRSALDLLWDARWSARIGADSIYSSAPSFGSSDCFKIRAEASIFVRASLIQRVWSIMGFKPVFKGSDKAMGCFRSSLATARVKAWLFGIVRLPWTWWCHCRQLEVIENAGTPSWTVFIRWNLVFVDFFMISIDFSLILFAWSIARECIRGSWLCFSLVLVFSLSFTTWPAREHPKLVICQPLSLYFVQLSLVMSFVRVRGHDWLMPWFGKVWFCYFSYFHCFTYFITLIFMVSLCFYVVPDL